VEEEKKVDGYVKSPGGGGGGGKRRKWII